MRSTQTLRSVAAFAMLCAVVPAATATAGSAETGSDSRAARAVIRNVSGTVLGTIRLDGSSGKTIVSGRLSGLSAGFHGFHIHAVGICDPRATDPGGALVPFLSAGGHLNPDGSAHGHHIGDLPSLLVSQDGTTSTAAQNDGLSAAQLFDGDGSAFIVHGSPDNFAHIPSRYSAAGIPGPDAATLATGDAGTRVACGVITRI